MIVFFLCSSICKFDSRFGSCAIHVFASVVQFLGHDLSLLDEDLWVVGLVNWVDKPIPLSSPYVVDPPCLFVFVVVCFIPVVNAALQIIFKPLAKPRDIIFGWWF